MFGFGKKKRRQKLVVEVVNRLDNILAYQKWENDGQVPDILKECFFVLGYYTAMGNLLYSALGGVENDFEENGYVLANAITISLQLDLSWQELSKKISSRTESQKIQFQMGANMAVTAFNRLAAGEVDAFMEFKNALDEMC